MYVGDMCVPPQALAQHVEDLMIELAPGCTHKEWPTKPCRRRLAARLRTRISPTKTNHCCDVPAACPQYNPISSETAVNSRSGWDVM